MTITLTEQVAKNIIKKLINGEDYRIKIVTLINAEFLQYTIDFYLCDKNNDYLCEVKLMGKGNPESADAVIARDSKVFIADKLSDTNKKQLSSLKIEWVELRDKDGYKRFKKALENLDIPYNDFKGDANKELDRIFSEVF